MANEGRGVGNVGIDPVEPGEDKEQARLDEASDLCGGLVVIDEFDDVFILAVQFFDFPLAVLLGRDTVVVIVARNTSRR